MDKKEPIFADGIYFDRPRPEAPKFVKGHLSIKVEQAMPFLATYKNQRGYVRFDLLVSKSDPNKLYFQLDNWVKPEGISKEPEAGKTYRSSLEGVGDYPESKGKTAFEDEIKAEDIPFSSHQVRG